MTPIQSTIVFTSFTVPTIDIRCHCWFYTLVVRGLAPMHEIPVFWRRCKTRHPVQLCKASLTQHTTAHTHARTILACTGMHRSFMARILATHRNA